MRFKNNLNYIILETDFLREATVFRIVLVIFLVRDLGLDLDL